MNHPVNIINSVDNLFDKLEAMEPANIRNTNETQTENMILKFMTHR